MIPSDRVVVQRMGDVPAIDVVPGVHVRTVAGTDGSFSLGEFEPGSVAPLRHHTREQPDIAVSGAIVPLLLLTHGLAFRILLQHHSQPCCAKPGSPPEAVTTL